MNKAGRNQNKSETIGKTGGTQYTLNKYINKKK